MTGKFFLVLHGLFVFVERKDRIDILLPNVGNEHVYWAGAWTKEKPLTQSWRYQLLGVKPGRKSFRADLNKDQFNILVNCEERRTPNRDNPYCVISVPRPYDITPMPGIKHDKSVFSGNQDLISRDNFFITEVQVLEYDIDSTSGGPSLAQHEGQTGDWGGSKVLHVFSSPKQMMCEEHTKRAFGKAVELVKGLSLSLIKPYDVDLPNPHHDKLPQEQLKPLPLRKPRNSGQASGDYGPRGGRVTCSYCLVLIDNGS